MDNNLINYEINVLNIIIIIIIILIDNVDDDDNNNSKNKKIIIIIKRKERRIVFVRVLSYAQKNAHLPDTSVRMDAPLSVCIYRAADKGFCNLSPEDARAVPR